jgi:hypothetical protein
VGFVEGALVLKCEVFVGHIGEWNLSGGDVMEHKVHDGALWYMALSGERIVTCDEDFVILVLKVLTCLLVLQSCYYL